MIDMGVVEAPIPILGAAQDYVAAIMERRFRKMSRPIVVLKMTPILERHCRREQRRIDEREGKNVEVIHSSAFSLRCAAKCAAKWGGRLRTRMPECGRSRHCLFVP